ncbi:MAG: S24/S26 family peptidase [Firmicutes bacterium]|nr:S24/S26 family peptidase [Bacillota bacterium]
MNKSVRLAQIYDIMKEKLDNGGDVIFNPHGISMLPILRNDGDRVVIRKKDGRLDKHDMAFFRRDNGQFVLHRVIKVNSDSYDMCGDNQSYIEKNVREDQIIAYVTGIYRGDKYISCDNKQYLLYVKIWTKGRFIRKIRDKTKGLLRKIKQKISKSKP